VCYVTGYFYQYSALPRTQLLLAGAAAAALLLPAGWRWRVRSAAPTESSALPCLAVAAMPSSQWGQRSQALCLLMWPQVPSPTP
jgi:peptidoglycan/LPS O-acetylase OafA/YrhL